MAFLNRYRSKEEAAIIRHNKMVHNPGLFVDNNYDTLRKNAIRKMERDGQDTANEKLVEQCVTLYISACINELKRRPKLYLR